MPRPPAPGSGLDRAPRGRGARALNRADESHARASLECLFRRDYARQVARLVARLGPRRLELVEDAVQSVLLRAARLWPVHGVPERPEAWLEVAARHAAIDALRAERGPVDAARALASDARGEDATSEPAAREGTAADGAVLEATDDEVLELMLLCCHPSLPVESRLALVLRDACGFGVREIAAALLCAPEAVKRRISRAHAALREVELPLHGRLDERRASLLRALYLLFNEGYAALEHEQPLRSELCGEALRLARLVVEDERLGGPDAEALCALFCLLAARAPARTAGEGRLRSLAEQDRGQWDATLRAEGLARLGRSARGSALSPYHLEAGIAAHHALAPSFDATDWRAVLADYDRLLALAPSPVTALARLVPLARVAGAEAALTELDALETDPRLADYPLRHAARAQLAWAAGHRAAAVAALERALAVEPSPARRDFLADRLARCRRGEPPPDL